jgi:hypothetical protein
MDLITAIFVSHVKILACVRLKSDNKSIKIKVPNLNTFLHKLLIKCCETLYYEPQIIHAEKYRVIEIISVSIEDTIANQVPIEYILSEYLAGAFDEEPDEQINLEHNTEVAPEMADENASDNESDANSEEGEYKNIPILPIKSRVGFQESLNNIQDSEGGELNDNKHTNLDNAENVDNVENVENSENVENYENIQGVQNVRQEPSIKKSSKIEDNSDEEYSDEDVSGEEISDEEDDKVKKNRSLF